MTAPVTIATKAAPAAVGPYSQAVSHDGLVFVSGQLGLDPATGKLKEGFAAQAVQALANLRAILEAAGCAVSDVLCVDVFVTDMSRFGELNELYADFFGEHKPARAAVEVSGLPLGGQVEFKCIARRGAPSRTA